MKETKFIFENKEVTIEIINGLPMFEIYSTGMVLGQVKKNKIGVEYPRKERINENIKNAEIKPCVHNGHTFISESQLYDLMLEMKTDKVKPFRKWIVNEVLPIINKTGGYVESNKEEEFINNYFSSFSDETKKSMVVDLQRKNDELQNEINQLKPDADMANDIIKTKGWLTLKQVADLIEIGRTTLCSLLRDKKILSKQTGYNEPMGQYIKSDYFSTIVAENEKTGHVSVVTLVSPKGLKFIYRLIKKNELLDEFNTTPLQEVQA
ncbi:phage antirepressor KilAC domain-containing protein [Anaerosporobacter sp.]